MITMACVTLLLISSVFLFLPHHFSISAMLIAISALVPLVFHKKDRVVNSRTLRYTSIILLGVALLWSCIAFMMFMRNIQGGCTGFWGVQMTCYSQNDFSYILFDTLLTLIAGITLLISTGATINAIRKK